MKHIITQKLILKAIKTLKTTQIKGIIGRQRLIFSYKEAGFYCFQMILHIQKKISYKELFKGINKPLVKYSTYMHNIKLFSSLFEYLFEYFNKVFNIKASNLLNIIDSTLIPEKDSRLVNQKDWDSGRVTTRTHKGEKIRTCGSKAYVILNRDHKVYHIERTGINYSDQNYLKNPHRLTGKLKGIILADRGFSNKLVRERLSHNKADVFNYDKPICKLISPPHYKENKKMSKKEYKIYKKRWPIETVFQTTKNCYAKIQLNLRGKYTECFKTAKLFATAILYNLSDK